jgi:DNA segregation ATPase FtsK/SpoIIIE-like protein
MKMSWTEWKEYEEKRRKLFEENGVADLAHYRAKARWTDPSIPDEEIRRRPV